MGKESPPQKTTHQPSRPAAVQNTAAGPHSFKPALAQDLTSRKPRDPDLLENNHLFRELFEHLKSGAAIYEVRQNGEEVILKELNKRAEYIERLTREDLLGREFREIFPGDEAAGLREVIQRVWLSGASEHMPPSYYEDEQSSGWREHFVYKLPSSEVVVIYDDITARVLAEKAQRQSEERLHQISKHLQDVLWITTPEFDKIFYVSYPSANPSSSSTWTPSKLTARPAKAALLSSDCPSCRRSWDFLTIIRLKILKMRNVLKKI
jgi:PAS domain-containing protein